ncbi:MAG: serine hydroxymethyltransferase [Sedimentisphaerales bacterium]|nr:serine hydroxymethyltransferase [Sedimentisphaerales bacterium]
MLSSQEYHKNVLNALKEQDPQIYKLITREYERLQNTLQLIAAENQCSQAVLAALGSIVQNKTTEGFPGARFHGGCEIVDNIENIAASRARETFGAQYANVQPHSGTSANQIVITAILEKDDTILSLGMDQGGHVSHGANVSFSGKYFKVYNYNVNKDSFLLDYDAIKAMAIAFKPKLIICGATAYSRTIDFKKFREIAERVGAYLLADISHIAGLVIAGAHPSPVNYAHFTTTSTYKPGGPRGGLILMGHDFDRKITVGGKELPLWKLIDKATFPGVQGTPYLNNIAAKAVFFNETLTEQYRARQFKIIENAKRLASNLADMNYDVLTGGTDNHMVLINISNLRDGMTGLIAQQCLEECGIIINMNKLPYDNKNAKVTSGIRLGTPIVTKNGMGHGEIDTISALTDTVLRKVKILSESKYEIDDSTRDEIREKVRQLCSKFPLC